MHSDLQLSDALEGNVHYQHHLVLGATPILTFHVAAGAHRVRFEPVGLAGCLKMYPSQVLVGDQTSRSFSGGSTRVLLRSTKYSWAWVAQLRKERDTSTSSMASKAESGVHV